MDCKVSQNIIRALAGGNPRLFACTFPSDAHRGGYAYTMGSYMPDCFEEVRVLPLEHVVPLVVEDSGCGALLPMAFRSERWWHISDAFGRFSLDKQASPSRGLHHLIHQLEQAFDDKKPAPIRLRHAFEIQLGCPIHLDLIGGISLQLPLALALLREIARTPDTGLLPWGSRPVFCTGKIRADGFVGSVNGLDEKVDAFIRECGEGHIAVLPHTLQGQLNAQGKVGSFSKVFFIKSISDLWHIMPGLKEALTRAPQPEEMEHILHKINDHRIRLEFRDIRLLSRWLLSYQQELPRYCQIQIALLQSLFLTQIGDAVSAKKALLQIEDSIVTPTEGKTSSSSLEQYNHALGADVKIHFAIRSTINAASLCNYEKAMRDMVYFQSEAAHCSPEMRAQYWNVRQMIALLMRDLDAAERFAHNATACAEFGLVAQIPFYRCQHAHLLIARATSTDCPHIRHSLLAQAAALLDAWANMNTARHPVFIVKRQEVFCAYLKSLIAKESRQAWMPPPDVPRDDEYLHAYHYLLFSCVRNPFNTEQDRLDALRKLYREFNNYTNKTNHMSIITIYYHIYALCYVIKCQNNDQCQLHCKRLLEQLHWFRRSNSPGWFDTMAEHVVKVRNQPTMAHMEKLCESLMFPHHLLL